MLLLLSMEIEHSRPLYLKLFIVSLQILNYQVFWSLLKCNVLLTTTNISFEISPFLYVVID